MLIHFVSFQSKLTIYEIVPMKYGVMRLNVLMLFHRMQHFCCARKREMWFCKS